MFDRLLFPSGMYDPQLFPDVADIFRSPENTQESERRFAEASQTDERRLAAANETDDRRYGT